MIKRMGTASEIDAGPAVEVSRVIGCYQGAEAGPSLVCVGSIHGNEPSGSSALRRVLGALEDRKPTIRGEVVGLTGNLRASSKRVRFLSKDLNRHWTAEHVAKLATGELPVDADSEDHEQAELLAALTDAFGRSRGGVYFMDLHTTSAMGGPFLVIGDTLRNRRFAMGIPAPIILGLEERLGGTLPEYVNSLGHVTVGFEAGQHDDPRSVDIHEAGIWLAMINAGIISEEDVPEADKYRSMIAEASKGVPRVLELSHHHRINPSDAFRMVPEIPNFEMIRSGQRLATDKRGDIVSPVSGRLLLPLYQGQGNDGYFLARGINPAWLTVSSWLRRMRLDRIVHWLPGVKRRVNDPKTVEIDGRVARWLVVQIFHLLGFRQRSHREGQWVFSRREHDDL